jgi:hypothetical protein
MCLRSARHGCKPVLGVTTQVDGHSNGMGCNLISTIGRIIMQYREIQTGERAPRFALLGSVPDITQWAISGVRAG